MFIDLRERKVGERERNIDVREKYQLVVSHACPNWGLNPHPRYVSCLRVEPTTSMHWDDALSN